MVMHSEFWFIPVDILMVACTTFVVLLASTFFLIVLLTESCRSVPILLALNSFISEALFGLVMFSMALFTLKNDTQRIRREDSLCIVRGYMSYALSAVRSHSYLLQSIYRYITIVHPSDLFWQSSRLQIILICITWLISMVHPLPFLFTGQITYNADNQVCHMPLQKYHFIFYTCFFAYLNPITIIVVIYVKLVQYVQDMNRLVTPTNQLIRAQRELKMVRRIVLLVIVLVTLGLPYTIFFIVSLVTDPPKYHFRIAFLFVDIALACVMVAVFDFTDPIKTFIFNKMTAVSHALLSPANRLSLSCRIRRCCEQRDSLAHV